MPPMNRLAEFAEKDVHDNARAFCGMSLWSFIMKWNFDTRLAGRGVSVRGVVEARIVDGTTSHCQLSELSNICITQILKPGIQLLYIGTI